MLRHSNYNVADLLPDLREGVPTKKPQRAWRLLGSGWCGYVTRQPGQ